jgi:hypothetical protein
VRVSDLSLAKHDGRIRLSARIAWEDRDTPPRTMWIDFPTDLRDEVDLTADAILPPALGAALRDGEQRLSIDAPACPRLLEGLAISAELIASWFPRVRATRIETAGTRASVPSGLRAALCLSGGVDSLSALQVNRDTVSANHPDSYRDGIYYFGLNTYDFDGEVPKADRVAAFQSHARRLERFGDAAGVRVLSVSTNIRTFAATWEDWDIGGQTPALVAGAHALTRRMRSLAIAGAGNGITPVLHGTHPLLDPHFSSFGLDVRVVEAMPRRFEKVARLAEWPAALDALHVCFLFDVQASGPPNCGRCEKCIRTMIELLLCGALDRASTFPVHDVTPEMIRGLDALVINPLFFTRCRPGLASIGRGDLVNAIDERMAAATRSKSLVARLFRR